MLTRPGLRRYAIGHLLAGLQVHVRIGACGCFPNVHIGGPRWLEETVVAAAESVGAYTTDKSRTKSAIRKLRRTPVA